MDDQDHSHPRLRVFSKAEAQVLLSNKELIERGEKLGVDVGLLVYNLQATPEMRLKRHANALRMVLAFKAAGERSRRK